MDKIYITADLHSNYLYLRNVLTNTNTSIINSTIIILEDFEAKFYLDKKDEKFKFKITLNQKDWNLILSHTCSTSYELTDLFLPMIDQTTVDKTTERWLQRIQNNINYDLWTRGYFHKNRIYPTQENKNHIML